jgi:hypothetical protein
MFARRWIDGALLRHTGTALASNMNVMADSIVLEAADPVPAGLPAGTIIVRLP